MPPIDAQAPPLLSEEPDFAARWAQARGIVRAVCHRLMRQADDADDVFQEVAIRAWRAYSGLRQKEQFLAWALAIARREAFRAMDRKGRRARRESSLDELLETRPGVLAAPSSDPLPPVESAAWLAEAVEAARDAGELAEGEAALIRCHLDHPEETWEAVGARFGLSATHAAVTHCRAIPKLRVFLFLRQPGRLGGLAAIRGAFEAARASKTAPLTREEEQVFDFMVLRRMDGYCRAGWRAALRAACEKVIARLAQP